MIVNDKSLVALFKRNLIGILLGVRGTFSANLTSNDIDLGKWWPVLWSEITFFPTTLTPRNGSHFKGLKSHEDESGFVIAVDSSSSSESEIECVEFTSASCQVQSTAMEIPVIISSSNDDEGDDDDDDIKDAKGGSLDNFVTCSKYVQKSLESTCESVHIIEVDKESNSRESHAKNSTSVSENLDEADTVEDNCTRMDTCTAVHRNVVQELNMDHVISGGVSNFDSSGAREGTSCNPQKANGDPVELSGRQAPVLKKIKSENQDLVNKNDNMDQKVQMQLAKKIVKQIEVCEILCELFFVPRVHVYLKLPSTVL